MRVGEDPQASYRVSLEFGLLGRVRENCPPVHPLHLLLCWKWMDAGQESDSALCEITGLHIFCASSLPRLAFPHPSLLDADGFRLA